jgi:hypothetical protein
VQFGLQHQYLHLQLAGKFILLVVYVHDVGVFVPLKESLAQGTLSPPA